MRTTKVRSLLRTQQEDTSKDKHIDIHAYIRDYIKQGIIEIDWVDTQAKEQTSSRSRSQGPSTTA